MGLSITDTVALVSKGYKVSELQEISKILDENKNDNNIIELAKKLAFSDFKSAMTLFNNADNSLASENASDDETDQETDDQQDIPDDQDDQGEEDGVDYKTLYEKEKKLREDIQKANQKRDVSDEDSKESDFDIALKFAQQVLN